MNEELSALAEISSKPLEELSKEEMARLVIPFLDTQQLKSKNTIKGLFSPLRPDNQYLTDTNIKELRRRPMSNEDYFNLYTYTKNLESKLHQIMNNPQKECYGMIPNALFRYVSIDGLDYNLDDVLIESMPEETIDINANTVRILLEMTFCQRNVARALDFYYFLSKDSFYGIPALTVGMMDDPSEFTYFAGLFKNGTMVAKEIKDIDTHIDIKFKTYVQTVIQKIAKNSNMDAFDIKLFYLINQGIPILVSEAGLRIRKQDGNVVEEVLSLSDSSILHRCLELAETWRKWGKYVSEQEEPAIEINSFELYEVSGGLVAVTKDGAFGIGGDKGASIKRFVNAVVTRALDVSHNKEDMIRNLVDIDR